MMVRHGLYKLFLGGISPNTTEEGIRDHFGKYGNIVDCVVMYKDGKFRGFGFVTFDTVEAMTAALDEEQELDGRKVDVKAAVPENKMAPTPPRSLNGGGGAYVGGNSNVRSAPYASARDACAPPGGAHYPPPAYVYAPPPPTYGGAYARGAYVGAYSASGPPPPAPAPPNQRGDSRCKVFIGGLVKTTTDDMVFEYFSHFGTLVDHVVMKDKVTRRSRGFGFVEYDNPAPVDQVMDMYRDHRLEDKWIEVKRAVPEGEGGGGRCFRAPEPPAFGGYPPPSYRPPSEGRYAVRRTRPY